MKTCPGFTKKIFFFILFFQFSCSGFLMAQSFSFEGKREKDAIDFKLVKNLIIIPIYINNKGPFNFILDTGVGPMIITDPSVMDSLHLKPIRVTKLSGIGNGPDIEAYLTDEIKVQVGKSSISNMPTAILKEDLFNLSNFVGVHIHGLIGYYFFNSFIVKINYPSRRMVFSLPDAPIKIKGIKIPLEMINNKPYVWANLELQNKEKIKAKLILDIGASHAVSLESLHEKAFPLPEKTIEANLGMGFTGLIGGHIGRINSLEIAGVTFKNVLSSFPDYEDAAAKSNVKERNGNLGSDLLKFFDLTFDYQNFNVYLKPSRYFKKVFEHDMSGMEVYVEERKFNVFIVGRIEPGSPAELADIRPGDQIVSINFKPFEEYNLNDIDLLLKSAENRRIILLLNRENKMIYKLLTLKRRI
eukprot:gene11297-13179_t